MVLCLVRPASGGSAVRDGRPEPTEYRHFEIYLGIDSTSGEGTIYAEAPTAQINYGLMPNVQFSVSLPMAATRAERGSPYLYVIGDTSVGAKVR